MRTLVLMRHASSDGMQRHHTDAERPLSDRGRHDAPKMARAIGRTIRPDLILSSTAARALATAELVAQELLPPRQKILVEPTLYESSVEGYFELITTLPESAESILLVGHNPTITEFANILAPGSVRDIPAGGVVAITADVSSWKDIDKNCGRLLFFEHPGSVRT